MYHATSNTDLKEATQHGINQTSSLTTKIDTLLKNERLDGAVTGISIRKADSGELVYSSFGDTRLHPASNMKLLTAAAALETLGTEYQFLTEVWIDGRIKGEYPSRGSIFKRKRRSDPFENGL